MHVLRPGLLTTVQDLGRTGHQYAGVPVGGAMDRYALRLANLLVGNAESDAALEVTLLGPTLELQGDVLLSIAGAHLSATLDERPLPNGRTVHAPAGARLAFGRPVAGCRAYVAFAGGIAVPSVLGSRATYPRARLGGVDGRALAAGDLLPLGELGARSHRLAAALPRGRVASWTPGPHEPARTGAAIEVRALRGAHFDALTPESRSALRGEAAQWFTITGEADRMGYRLDGPGLELAAPLELVSEPVAFGTVQLPPGGQPIVLMADRQTTGGYPRVLEAISADLPLLAQAAPGARIRFREVSLAEARRLYLAREHELARIALAIDLQLA
ncbi:MAG: biotin-dependent carboxyltransferase family protein [Gemmatimonadetes bacterium]|nr:biotin-dependent carboxyltransferase family protein [Gemmatimonadota bacterium]